MARLLLLLMGVFPVLPLAAPKRGAGDTGEAAGNWALTLSGTSRNGSLGVEIAQQTSPASLESDTLAMLPTDVQQPIAQVFRQVQLFVQLCASEEEDPRNNPQWPSVLATLNKNLFRATEYVDMDVIIEVARQRCEACRNPSWNVRCNSWQKRSLHGHGQNVVRQLLRLVIDLLRCNLLGQMALINCIYLLGFSAMIA